MSGTCDRSVVFSVYSGFLHDIAEILLKVALNTITLILDFFRIHYRIDQTPSASSGGFDLLGSIMDNQELLTKDSKDVTIQRDGKMWCDYIRNLKRLIFWGCSSFLILTDQKANLLKKRQDLRQSRYKHSLSFKYPFLWDSTKRRIVLFTHPDKCYNARLFFYIVRP